MLTAALTVSHLFCPHRYFTSAPVRLASDEEKTCESVTHSCTHDSKAKRGSLKWNEHNESQSEQQPEVNWYWVISLKIWNLLVLSEMGGSPGSLCYCVLHMVSGKEKKTTK